VAANALKEKYFDRRRRPGEEILPDAPCRIRFQKKYRFYPERRTNHDFLREKGL
jgi:hypothetical protein